MIGRNDPCWCGSAKKWKKCHYPSEPPISDKEKLCNTYLKQYQIILKTPEQIEGIKRACQLAASILDTLCKKAQIGVTTNDLDALAVQLHQEAGARAAPYHYGHPPFPKSICTSLNEVICHGIPNDVPLKEGDIMNIDVSVILDGYYGDCSRMVKIGDVTGERQLVYDVSSECLARSIEILKPGVMLHEIGDVIEDHAAARGCSVVNQFVGHGVGLQFHEPPQVPHHRNHLKIPLAPGMTFTIEPMINAGVREAVIDPVTQWIATTKDGRASAQWEHTVLITETGHEILTLLK
ncbi:MAG: Methionine aminopeptidase [Chlamydiales bacterium]|nr:Methionine aminopeptidase [Chlamydiales bacterium]